MLFSRNSVVLAMSAALQIAWATASVAAPSAIELAFDRLKSLSGEWTLQGHGDGAGETVRYEVVSEGSAVVEYFHGMVTVFHKDGNTLLATHYCTVGNQPRFRATEADVSPAGIHFGFVDVSNLASPEAGHMAGLDITFAGADAISTKWAWVQGQREADYEEFSMQRKSHVYLVQETSEEMRPTLYIPLTTETALIGGAIASAMQRLYGYAAQVGTTAVDAPYARFLSYGEQTSQYEVGIVVSNEAAGAGDIVAGTIGGEQLLKVEYFGPNEGIGPVYESLHSYMTQHSLVADGAPWESYESDLRSTPIEFAKTVVYYPVKASN